MYQINIIQASEQAFQAFSSLNSESTTDNGFIHAGIFGFISWAYVSEDLYFPTHRKGGFELFAYELSQSHAVGDHLEPKHRFKQGDMLIVKEGATDHPFVKRVGSDFSAFQFWFSESGLLTGEERTDFMKITADQFPCTTTQEVLKRELFGPIAPVNHINGLIVCELIISAKQLYTYSLSAKRKLGVYVISGDGSCNHKLFKSGDFLEINHTQATDIEINFKSMDSSGLHLILMEIAENE